MTHDGEQIYGEQAPIGVGVRVAALLMPVPLSGFLVGMVGLLGHLTEESLWEFASLPIVGALAGGSYAVLVVGARMAGTNRMMQIVEVWRRLNQRADFDASMVFKGSRSRYAMDIAPAGGGVTEIASVPLLMFVPLIVVFWGEAFGGSAVGGAAIVVLLVAGISTFTFALVGQGWIALGLTLTAWLPCVVLIIVGWPWVGVAVACLSGSVSGVLATRDVAARRRKRADEGADV